MTLLVTKLHRPAVPADLVVRPRLTDKLQAGLSQPLTLICAPAGYGKTVLAASFLATCPLPSVWLSLDAADDDPRVFLNYLLGAIDARFPGAVRATQLIAAGNTLPSVPVVAASLINELAGLGSELILALDDAQEIRDPDIHRLLDALLRHPLRGLHLMLLARREPAMALGALRMHGQVAEVRTRDLCFSVAETVDFIDRAAGTGLHDTAVALTEQTEGWAAGLRLAALTLRYGGSIERQVVAAHTSNRYVTDYLASEVLTHLPPEVQEFLVKTAILDRLSGPLCDAVMQWVSPPSCAQACLEWLENANLFTTSLDEQRRWYRYHHLFQVLLQNELGRQHSAGEIHNLHRRASDWYAAQGEIDTALHHALAGEDTAGAVQLVAQHRHRLLNTEQRPRLERWLHRFSNQEIARYPDLLLSRAWILELGRSQAQTVMETLDQAQALVDQMGEQSETARRLQGEIDVLHSIHKSLAANDPEGVIALTTRALEAMPEAWYFVRTEARLWQAMAYEMVGQLSRAYAICADGRREDEAQHDRSGRMVASSCFIYWMAGDLHAMARAAQAAIEVRQQGGPSETHTWGHYFLACAYYQWNELEAAEQHARIVQALCYVSHPTCVLHNTFILTAIQQARGLPQEALQELKWADAFLLETHSEPVVPIYEGFGAELATAQGDAAAGGRWAATIGAQLPMWVMALFYTPQLTLPRVLLALNTPDSRQQAAAALARLHSFVTTTHNTRFTIDVLALQSLLQHAEGDEAAALETLAQAVALARPGGFIRVFADMGPAMSCLLTQLARRGVEPAYVEQLLRAFPTPPSPATASPASPSPVHPPQRTAAQRTLIEPLTYREQEVLALLVKRYSAKEIAQSLVISETTAKKHTANIYQKLGVNKRSEAVAAAISLHILDARA